MHKSLLFWLIFLKCPVAASKESKEMLCMQKKKIKRIGSVACKLEEGHELQDAAQLLALPL